MLRSDRRRVGKEDGKGVRMCVRRGYGVRRSLNIRRCAELQVSFDTYSFHTLERSSSEIGKGEARQDHLNILEK